MEEKALEILRKIVHLVNDEEKNVVIAEDWGGNSLTIYITDEASGAVSHTHCGDPDYKFEDLVDDLHRAICGGPHLSWHTEIKAQPGAE